MKALFLGLAASLALSAGVVWYMRREGDGAAGPLDAGTPANPGKSPPLEPTSPLGTLIGGALSDPARAAPPVKGPVQRVDVDAFPIKLLQPSPAPVASVGTVVSPPRKEMAPTAAAAAGVSLRTLGVPGFGPLKSLGAKASSSAPMLHEGRRLVLELK